MLLTARDVIDRLLDWGGDNTSAANARAARFVVADALREVGAAHTWSYLRRIGRLATVAPYQTGTVAYDHTGGSVERQLTLSGGTFPDWAADGVAVIANIVYEVQARVSSTILQLTESSNPGADVASGTYTLYREGYPLPQGLRALSSVSCQTYGVLSAAPLARLGYLTRRYVSSGVPREWCVTGSEDYFGQLDLKISPFPDQAYQVDFHYLRYPRPVAVLDYGAAPTDGTVSCSSSSATLTGSGTAFTQDMVGSVVRLSTGASLPTNEAGGNKAALERSVVSVESATSLTLDAAAGQTLSGVRFLISDPIDVDDVVRNLFLRCCEKHMAYARRTKDVQAAEALYQQELARAMAADSRVLDRQDFLNVAPIRMRDMPLGGDAP